MPPGHRINIAVAGGPNTGKSTLAAYLFYHLKVLGYDYDLVTEEKRKLAGEFGHCRTPFERFYLWRQQEREELRSAARDGFVTDAHLFYHYINAKLDVREPRDKLAVRELFRMCLDLEDRYHLIAIAKNPLEIKFSGDYARTCSENDAVKRHNSQRSFVEHFWPEKLLLIEGSVENRAGQIESRLNEIRSLNP